MDDAKALIKRFESAAQRKALWNDHFEQCYAYALPHREHFNGEVRGAKKNTHIYDSTAVDAVQRFKSRLQANVCPPWRQWTKYTPGSNTPKKERENTKLIEAMDDATDIFFDHMNHSNFDVEVNEAFGDLAVSTGALLSEYEVREGKLRLIFTACPLGELVLEEGPNGIIETVWRQRKIPLRNVERTWKGAKLEGKLAKQAESKPDEEKVFVEGVVYDPEADHYFGVAIEKGSKAIVWRGDYKVSPWIVFRWAVKPGEIYGRGPVMFALPDILTANKVVEYVLRNAAMAISGVYTSTDAEVVNPYTARFAPSMIIPVRSNDNQNPTLRPLERSGDFNVAQLVLDELRENIKRALYNNLRTAEGPVKSATEIALDHMELVQDTGSAFGRLQTELIARLVRRVSHILAKEGKLPEMLIDGEDVDLQHTSPLAQAQDQADIITVQQTLETVMPLGMEAVGVSLRVEDIPGYVAKKAGFPGELQREEGEQQTMKEQIRDLVVQQIAAQQAAQQGGGDK
jgi:hypothetical protein